MSTWLLAVLMVGSSVAVAVVGLLVVRRAVPATSLHGHHDVAGFIIAVLGVIYAVLLALVVIAVWEDFEAARVTVVREADGVVGVFRMSQGLPPALRQRVHRQARAYAQVVINEEWPLMARGKESPRAWAAIDELWRIFTTMEPRTERESALYTESLTALRELGDNRRLRLLESHEGVPAIMWIVLYSGGLCTIVFTYFFGVENFRAQALMTVLLTAEIALVLFLISALNYAFAGDVRVQPDAFRHVLETMDIIEAQEKASIFGAPRPRPPKTREG
jgi:Protein of unknown function (DUF4239)